MGLEQTDQHALMNKFTVPFHQMAKPEDVSFVILKDRSFYVPISKLSYRQGNSLKYIFILVRISQARKIKLGNGLRMAIKTRDMTIVNNRQTKEKTLI